MVKTPFEPVLGGGVEGAVPDVKASPLSEDLANLDM
jgi:hypothetical protein